MDEALRGYMTKYDCSSADVNPIGGMSKGDLKKMLLYASDTHQLPALREIATAVPTVGFTLTYIHTCIPYILLSYIFYAWYSHTHILSLRPFIYTVLAQAELRPTEGDTCTQTGFPSP